MLYCDLDGVLCFFEQQFEEKMGINMKKYLQKYNIRRFWQDVEQYGVEWWSEMNWMPDGKQLWSYLIENYPNVEILTGSPFGKVGQYAQQGKEEWVSSELGFHKVNHYNSSNKWRLAEGPQDILIDDS
jgi:hypothetical protein